MRPYKMKIGNTRTEKLGMQIFGRNGLTELTVWRYVAQFKKEGFGGGKQKAYRSVLRELQDNMVKQAIRLRRKAPSRSIASFIQIFE